MLKKKYPLLLIFLSLILLCASTAFVEGVPSTIKATPKANTSIGSQNGEAVNEPSPKTELVQTKFHLNSATGSVQGTSSIHNWASAITRIECKGSFQSWNNTIVAIQNVEVKIPVEGILSDHGRSMDNKTYEAFKSALNPYITYTFNYAQLKVDSKHAIAIDAYGSLAMAGTSRMVSVAAIGKILANGDLEFSFSKKLKMTEFNMAPPTFLMGAVKSGDEVTISVDLVLASSK